MTDRELLERAANAARIPLRSWYDNPGAFHTSLKHPRSWWNALTDYGDALRLAQALRLDIEFHNGGQVHVGRREWASDADICRAIVRAAAAMGEQ